jgi:hypothetical protein
MTWMCIGFTSLAFKHSFLFNITSFQVFEIFHAFALVDCRRMSNEAKEVLKSWPKKAFEKLKSQNRWDLAPTCLDILAPWLSACAYSRHDAIAKEAHALCDVILQTVSNKDDVIKAWASLAIAPKEVHDSAIFGHCTRPSSLVNSLIAPQLKEVHESAISLVNRPKGSMKFFTPAFIAVDIMA